MHASEASFLYFLCHVMITCVMQTSNEYIYKVSVLHTGPLCSFAYNLNNPWILRT